MEKLGLTPIILDEQGNKGLTIIEKFISNTNVSFAVVLLSLDDKCGEKAKKAKEQKFQARQNVIFELGFFLESFKGRKFSLYEGLQGILNCHLTTLGSFTPITIIQRDNGGSI